ncbi:helix-turn-helix domain-containing protein [Rhodococcus maanshanensis]|uniref:helix-turn-helix domain-containing protein n=1 Tax=Rhodococcus maanshanensis TaxID=183556 RepID=UPI0022B2AE01|nr:helix-turn-helix domain-containing protein [Rhodococcus maanshanensis]MCZ4557924.1 helix-turn-helix domain-containing protein [Rhodococcus maanshanensis]
MPTLTVDAATSTDTDLDLDLSRSSLWTIADTVTQLRLGETFIREAIKTGELPAYRLGAKIVRIVPSEAIEWATRTPWEPE